MFLFYVKKKTLYTPSHTQHSNGHFFLDDLYYYYFEPCLTPQMRQQSSQALHISDIFLLCQETCVVAYHAPLRKDGYIPGYGIEAENPVDASLAYILEAPNSTPENQRFFAPSDIPDSVVPIALWEYEKKKANPRITDDENGATDPETLHVSSTPSIQGKEEQAKGLRVAWSNGEVRDYHIMTGSLERKYAPVTAVTKFMTNLRVIAAHCYGINGLFFVLSGTQQDTCRVVALELSLSGMQFWFTWENCPSQVVLPCIRASILDEEGTIKRSSGLGDQPVDTQALVALTQDRKGLLIYTPYFSKADPGVGIYRATEWSLSLDMFTSNSVTNIFPHPRAPLMAFAACDGTLGILRYHQLSSDQEKVDFKAFMKRWHSRSFDGATWALGEGMGSENSFFTGGKEGVLCTWSTVTFKMSTLPHFPGNIIQIIPCIGVYTHLAVLLDTHRLILVNSSRNNMECELTGVRSSYLGTHYTRMSRVFFRGKKGIACYGGKTDEIRFLTSSGETAHIIPSTTLKNRIIPVDEGHKVHPTNTVETMTVLRHMDTDHIVVAEVNPIGLLGSEAMRNLRFFRYDKTRRNAVHVTVVYEPHLRSRMNLYKEQAKGDSHKINCVDNIVSPPCILCSHPTDGIVLSAGAQDTKIWAIKKFNSTEKLGGGVQASALKWDCVGNLFRGSIAAAFSEDGTVLGCCQFPGHSYILYNAQTLCHGGPWEILRTVSLPREDGVLFPSPSSTLRNVFFGPGDSYLIGYTDDVLYGANPFDLNAEFKSLLPTNERIRECLSIDAEHHFVLWTHESSITILKLTPSTPPPVNGKSQQAIKVKRVVQKKLPSALFFLNIVSLHSVANPAEILVLFQPTSGHYVLQWANLSEIIRQSEVGIETPPEIQFSLFHRKTKTLSWTKPLDKITTEIKMKIPSFEVYSSNEVEKSPPQELIHLNQSTRNDAIDRTSDNSSSLAEMFYNVLSQNHEEKNFSRMVQGNVE